MIREILISLPFAGLWLARNSPARRIPSHGTDLLGERYAFRAKVRSSNRCLYRRPPPQQKRCEALAEADGHWRSLGELRRLRVLP